MRSYPCNSPEAAARIVALVLISDGHVCCSEEVPRPAGSPRSCQRRVVLELADVARVWVAVIAA